MSRELVTGLGHRRVNALPGPAPRAGVAMDQHIGELRRLGYLDRRPRGPAELGRAAAMAAATSTPSTAAVAAATAQEYYRHQKIALKPG